MSQGIDTLEVPIYLPTGHRVSLMRLGNDGTLMAVPMMDEKQQLALPSPIQQTFNPSPSPTPPAGHGFKDVLIVLLLVAVAGAGGYGASEYKHWELQQSLNSGMQPEGSLTLPPEITLIAGEGPRELRAETAGRRVYFQPLDKELIATEYTPKSVWVWSAKAGTYSIQAWTAVNNMPTRNSVCIVKVTDPQQPEKEKKNAKGD